MLCVHELSQLYVKCDWIYQIYVREIANHLGAHYPINIFTTRTPGNQEAQIGNNLVILYTSWRLLLPERHRTLVVKIRQLVLCNIINISYVISLISFIFV